MGARSIVLEDVKAGNGAVIGAGSVVASDISSFSIVAGNLARLVKNNAT